MLYSSTYFQFLFTALLILLLPTAAKSADNKWGDTVHWRNMLANQKDSTKPLTDTVGWMRPGEGSLEEKISGSLKHRIRRLNDVDTNFIEPQKYNYAFMIQNTNTYEVYRIQSKLGYGVTFAPNISLRVGPYFGWRWIFIGYTIDVTHLHDEVNDRTDFNLSLYSNKVGLDLYYRQTGDGYFIRRADFGSDFDDKPLRNVEFGGITTSNKGFNAYYIFNHRRFSYPAAFSQSTVQRRSAGSPLIGLGYSNQRVSVDWRALDQLIEEKTGSPVIADRYDSTLVNTTFHYDDFFLTAGYAYNWVFARNWLMDISLSGCLSYKRTRSNVEQKWYSFRDFTVKDINVDASFRFAVVYNNMKWYYGMSIVTHGFQYRRDNFSADNLFGTLNVYAGFNFGHKYNKKKKKDKKK